MMLLDVRDLTVEVENKTVLKDLSLSIGFGETVLLMGPNGSGKSSLIYTIMGHPKYKIKKGTIIMKGTDITFMPTEERVKLGLGASFQFPPKIHGVTLRDLARRLESKQAKRVDIQSLAASLNLSAFLDREINVGFSGGEIKRVELFFLMLQKPSLVLLDEPDSGVDVENMVLVGNTIGRLLGDESHPATEKPSGLIVTHLGYVSRYVLTHRTYIIQNGSMICYGETESLVKDVLKHGFERCTQCYSSRRPCPSEGKEVHLKEKDSVAN
ncbi:MAG: ABC transporter ATP-binding protein [Nitrososphaeria archaeon]